MVRVGIHFIEVGILVVEPAVEKEVLKELQQIFSAQVVEGIGNVFGVFDKFHSWHHACGNDSSGVCCIRPWSLSHAKYPSLSSTLSTCPATDD